MQNEDAVAPPSFWEWFWAGASAVFIGGFAIALTIIRNTYSHAIDQAQRLPTSSTQITGNQVHYTVPGWVLGILALVAPLLCILAEFAFYHPHAHRLRRGLRLYAWNARKLRFVMHRSARSVRRARRALLSYDNPRSRAHAMHDVIDAHHGPAPRAALPTPGGVEADEPIRQLRKRVRIYDEAVPIATLVLLKPSAQAQAERPGTGAPDETALQEMIDNLLAPATSANGRRSSTKARS